jgi:pimeloyl-ACP methyl ester carboxylesterase
MIRLVRTILIILAAVYLAACIALYFAQSRLLFPTWLIGASGPLPPGAERLTLDAPDGTRLEGVHLPPLQGQERHTLILSFAGNATNAQDLAMRLRSAFPEHPIVAFHYRGYGPSGGTAGAEAIAEDAPLAYDHVVALYRPQRVVALGVSLGSGVAATLAARRPLSGLILVTPFDSLKNVARQIYWWVPVSMLMKHDLDSAAALANSSVPTAIVAAPRDELVRPERTDALRRAIRTLRHDAVLPGATHNDIFMHPGFDPTLREALAKIVPRTMFPTCS